MGKFLKSDDYNHGWNFPLSLEHSNFYSKNSQSPKYIGLFSNLIMNVTADGVFAAYIVDSRNFVNKDEVLMMQRVAAVSYTHLRAHETLSSRRKIGKN